MRPRFAEQITLQLAAALKKQNVSLFSRFNSFRQDLHPKRLAEADDRADDFECPPVPRRSRTNDWSILILSNGKLRK